MRQVVFLLGGTGNQLFQIATSDEDALFSYFFLRPWVRRALGWDNHQQILTPPSAGIVRSLLGFILLFLDLVLAKLISTSLFTDFDTTGLKLRARKRAMVRLGYFQGDPRRREVSSVFELNNITPPYRTAIHYRRGDLDAQRALGKDPYGRLDQDYYGKLKLLGSGSIVVLTDDAEAAREFFSTLSFFPRAAFLQIDLRETMEIALSVERFVSCPSTLSFWICEMREGRGCVVQKPFFQKLGHRVPKHLRTRPAIFEDLKG